MEILLLWACNGQISILLMILIKIYGENYVSRFSNKQQEIR